MLILSREVDEVIVIEAAGKRIDVMITAVRGDRVRLGIQAPSEVSVNRLEVFEAIQRERKSA